MDWASAASAALSIGGSLFGSSDEKKKARKAAERQRVLEGKSEGVRRNFYTEAEKLTRRSDTEAQELLGRVTGAGERIFGDADVMRQTRDTTANTLQQALTGNFQNTPGYEFIRSEALRGTARGEAAQGRNISGNALIALQDRAASVASTEYNNIIGTLTSLLGTTGQAASSASSQYGNLISNANNMYSDLFKFGQGTASNLKATGEGSYLDTVRGVEDSLSGIELYKGQVSANLAGNIGDTLGSALSGMFGKGA